jgi:hypothetical protein
MEMVVILMSDYTAELRDYIEQYQNSIVPLNTSDLIEAGRPNLFDFNYPIYDPVYKSVFETHFIRKFYLREIGFETFGLFKFQLETWLLVNMPYFNKLFESELLAFDPLKNSEINSTYTKKNDQAQNDQSNSTNNRTSSGSTNGSSDTALNDDDFERILESTNPDTRLALTASNGQGVIEYASSIKEQNVNNSKTENSNASSTSNETDDSTLSNTLTSTVNNIEDYIQYRAGKIGVQTYSKMLTEYRDVLLRIEATIFNEMNELFMLVY